MNHLRLVTGGSGYFGSLLFRLLSERGLPVWIFNLVIRVLKLLP